MQSNDNVVQFKHRTLSVSTTIKPDFDDMREVQSYLLFKQKINQTNKFLERRMSERIYRDATIPGANEHYTAYCESCGVPTDQKEMVSRALRFLRGKL